MSGLAKCECGGAPHVWENSPPRAFSATCRACGANGPWKATRPGAVAAWNALPRRSDVAAAFEKGVRLCKWGAQVYTPRAQEEGYVPCGCVVDWHDVDVYYEKDIAELNGGALPKYFTVADIAAAMREALEICRTHVRIDLGDYTTRLDVHWDDAEAAINARIAEYEGKAKV